MIPDGRISRVRFAAANCSAVRLPPGVRAEARGRHTLRLRKFTPGLAPVFGSGVCPGSHPGPCVLAGRVACPQALRAEPMTAPSPRLRPDGPVLWPLARYAGWRARQSLPLGPPAAGPQDLPDVLSAHRSPECLDPYPGCLVWCPGPLLPTERRPSRREDRSAPGVAPHATSVRCSLSRRQSFAALQACRMCLPPRSLPPIRHTRVWRP